jgi:type I restriction enzyme S subunit
MKFSKLQTLVDVCELIVDCEHKTAPTQSSGYPSIRTPNIGKGRLILDGVNRVSEETYRYWTQREIPQAGDLILAREAPIGNVAIIPSNLKVCLGQRTVLIRPNRKVINPYYLVYLLLGEELQAKIHSLSNGATVHHLNMADIRSLGLPKLPPLPTQRKIAAILSTYDNLIENNTRRIAILEEMAQALYREWFVHFRYPGHEKKGMVESALGMIPDGWKVVKLGDAVELAYGKALKADTRVTGKVPVYGSGGIVGYHNEGFVKGPGIIVGRKGNVGSVFWSDYDFYPIDTVYYVRSKVSLHYLYFNLRAQNFINNDAAVPGLNRNQAYSLPFLLPSDEILAQFQELVSQFFKQTKTLTERNINLRRTRDLLLPRLISGEVDVEGLDIETGEGMSEAVASIEEDVKKSAEAALAGEQMMLWG